MSKPRYTAVESQLMISPPNRSASARARALLPVAVDPRMATTSGFDTTITLTASLDRLGMPRARRPSTLLGTTLSLPKRRRAEGAEQAEIFHDLRELSGLGGDRQRTLRSTYTMNANRMMRSPSCCDRVITDQMLECTNAGMHECSNALRAMCI